MGFQKRISSYVFLLFALHQQSVNTASAARPCVFQQSVLKNIVSNPEGGAEYTGLIKSLALLTEDGAKTSGPGLKVVMAAVELGQIKGLKTVAGKAVNISAGGAFFEDILE